MKKKTAALVFGVPAALAGFLLLLHFANKEYTAEEKLSKMTLGMTADEVYQILGKADSDFIADGASLTKFWTEPDGTIAIQFSLRGRVIHFHFSKSPNSASFLERIKRWIGL